MWQLVHNMFVTDIHALSHLRWKENLAKNQKVSKYHDLHFLQNFILLFISLLASPIVKIGHVLAGAKFVFLRNELDQTWKSYYIKFGPQEKVLELFGGKF